MDAVTVKILEDVQLVNLLNTANAALFGYEYLITFSQEVKYIREKPFSPITLLFLLSRYLPAVDIALVIISQQPNISPSICQSLVEASGMMCLCGVLLSEVVLVIRTWAVWNQDRWIALILAVCTVATWIPSLYSVQVFLGGLELSPTGPGCQVIASQHTRPFVAYILVTGFETVLLALTLFKTVSGYLRTNSSLYSTLVRDGIVFYVALQVICICSLAVVATLGPEFSDLLTLTHRVLHGMLSVRLLLNLRSAASRSPGSLGSSPSKLPWKAIPPTATKNLTFEMTSWSASIEGGQTSARESLLSTR